MKALPVDKLPEGDWLYEIKHDGYRALAFKEGKDVRLISRNKKAFDYPQLLDALKLLPAGHFILDGEIAALDEKGRSSFQLLSGELRGSKDELLRVAQEFGLEGLVAKRPNSVYKSGRRSGTWVKFKITKSQEFIIGGYTLPQANRKYFGSLLVGYQGPDGLIFAGRSDPVFQTRSW